MFQSMRHAEALAKAGQAMVEGDYEAALDVYRSVLAECGSKTSKASLLAHWGIGQALCSLAFSNNKPGNHDDRQYIEARQHLEAALAQADSIKPSSRCKQDQMLARIHAELALCCSFCGDIASCRKHCSAATDIANEARLSDTAPEVFEQCMESCAFALAHAGDLDAAFKLAPTPAVLDAYLSAAATAESPDSPLASPQPNKQLRAPDALPFARKLLDAQTSGVSQARGGIGAAHRVLGAIYEGLQDQDRAFDEYCKALEADRAELDDLDPQVAADYLALGRTCVDMGDDRDAIDCLTKGLRLLERAGASDARVLFPYRYDLAWAYVERNDFEHASEHARKASDLSQRMLDSQDARASDAYLDTLRLCGYTAFCRSEQQPCVAYNARLADIIRPLPEPERARRIFDLVFAGTQAVLMDDAEMACALASDYLDVLPFALRYVCAVPSEDIRESYIRAIREGADIAYSAFFDFPDALSPARLYAMELAEKNANAEISYQQMQLASSADGQRLATAAERMGAARSSLYARSSSPDASNVELERLQGELDAASAEFALCLQQTGFQGRFSQASPEEVRNAIKPGEAIIEYVRWTRWRMDAGEAGSLQLKPDFRYLAYVVGNARIELTDLGPCDEIDGDVQALVAAMAASNQPAEKAPTLGATHESNGLDAIESRLYRRLVLPLEQWLDGIEKVCIVPDDMLYRLPFELLAGDDGVSLGTRWGGISYLSSGREIARPLRQAAGNGVRIVANPLFDLGSTSASEGTGNDAPDASRELRSYLRTEGIKPLPFTEVEADGIASLFKPQDSAHAKDEAVVIKGIDAKAQALSQGMQASILHVATHGFAFPASPDKVEESPLGTRGEMVATNDSPLARCGLLFAGACNWLRGEDLPAEFGRGMLTAGDVLSLNLHEVDLLVLSACQTGLGDVMAGEGVKGLRRSFELAGVGAIVSSLWSVDDLASAILMKRFYECMEAEDHGHPSSSAERHIAAALSNAKDYLRSMSVEDLAALGYQDEAMDFAEQGLSCPFEHPRYWAAFVLQGIA